jgi:hypothetical protein
MRGMMSHDLTDRQKRVVERRAVGGASFRTTSGEGTDHMRYGVTMFVTDVSIGVVDLARAVEERGLDSLWLPEHTHIPTSRMTPHPWVRPPAPPRRCGSAPASCCPPSASRS